ncbi:MAG: DUF839 domain-containing protein [Methylotenera sp.]|jgi:hypothetical protein|uniref:alkaline phosphatase PhoX n=1 Tax=Methylotenera sp. TaxID=2051956 RepID=UPI002716377E|nr:alkaline phosphatase PhoX [Methylotenera sp.]MDO9150266.1 DUF839 domain-containing protein [Methylotenera sp.]
MFKNKPIVLAISLSLSLGASYAIAEQGPSSSQTPYITSTAKGWEVTSIMTVGDQATNGFKMVGIPDGLGAYDNDDNTFTLLMNHELAAALGKVRAHGASGAFVSEFKINKNTLTVISGNDLAINHQVWNGTNYQPASGAANSFVSLCSGDLPAATAFYNASTGLGTKSRIFMTGEESGTEGRAYAFIATGPDKGTAYELPRMGNFSFENSLANPYSGDQTIVVATNDSTPGQVYLYKGTKTNTGSDIDRAGLTNGNLYGIKVKDVAIESGAINGKFTLEAVNYDQSGVELQIESNAKGITNFARPEDGQWADAVTFYFATTGTANGGSSKLYRLNFDHSMGGTISMIKDSASLTGTDGQTARNFDNITVDTDGNILIQEDPGNNAYVAKTWKFDTKGNTWTQIFESDRNRFVAGAANFLTQNEENSGIIDVTNVLKRNDGKKYYLGVTQAHYGISGELVEGGQLYIIKDSTP